MDNQHREIDFHSIVPRTDMAMSLLLGGIVIAPPILVMVLMSQGGASWWEILLVCGIMVGIVVAVFILVNVLMWNPLARKYPPKPILDGAVARSGHSVAYGMLRRFNGCMTIIADAEHLHIVPVAFMRMFGARRTSIPWAAIRRVRSCGWPRYSHADVDGVTLFAPTWCLSLADDRIAGEETSPESRT